jgi:hypothetical protein
MKLIQELKCDDKINLKTANATIGDHLTDINSINIQRRDLIKQAILNSA